MEGSWHTRAEGNGTVFEWGLDIIVLEYLDRNMWYETGNERDSVTALALSPEASHR